MSRRLLWLPAVAALTATSAPSWDALRARALATPTGARLEREANARALGEGPPYSKARLRLFGAEPESADRVTLYRDDAAWCPYCQKVWLLLEELRIPHRVVTVPLRAYGDKPAWFTRLVDGGQLPAVELDGELLVESATILERLDEAFAGHMLPARDDDDAVRADALLKLERELLGAWGRLCLEPSDAVDARFLSAFYATLQLVDDALGETEGPWLLGGERPSIVDLQYISHFERSVASLLYWKGLDVRDAGYDRVERWLSAFEARESYRATMSDDDNHALQLPSQYGYASIAKDARDGAAQICGLDGAWELGTAGAGDASARHEAARALAENAATVVRFAARGAANAGRPSYTAELADPCAEPNEALVEPVDMALRHVAPALLDGADDGVAARARSDLAGRCDGALADGWEPYVADDGRTYYWNDETGEDVWTPPTRQLDACLAYLRDRVGVPRDMSAPAAMSLRAHLNWAISFTREASSARGSPRVARRDVLAGAVVSSLPARAGAAAEAERVGRTSGAGTSALLREVTDPATYSALSYAPPGKSRLPLIVVLPGAGENKRDVWNLVDPRGEHRGLAPSLLATGLAPSSLSENFAVVAPYAKGLLSFYAEPRSKMLAFINWVLSPAGRAAGCPDVDPSRVFLFGFSDGATEAVELLTTKQRFGPNEEVRSKFAGGVICSYGFTGTLPAAAASRLSDVPVWEFHSAVDAIFDVANSDRLVATLRRAGTKNDVVRYTRYDTDPENVTGSARGHTCGRTPPSTTGCLVCKLYW